MYVTYVSVGVCEWCECVSSHHLRGVILISQVTLQWLVRVLAGDQVAGSYQYRFIKTYKR